MTAPLKPVTLDDKFRQLEGRAYITGIQALVRVALDRARLDASAGMKTGGFISGYRGSPLGGFDQQLAANPDLLAELSIRFQPGVNEDLAATAVWGSQKVALAPAGSDYDGVFGIWYGKAPGVDRAGDVLKHANASGTDPRGGVLAIAGDDHTAKSSSMPAQSEFAFQDAEIPVLNPADLQEVLDFGLMGLELSRYSGLWTGLIALADTMDSSGSLDVSLSRHRFALPENPLDEALRASFNRHLNLATRLEVEHSLRELRLPAAQAFVRANRLDRPDFGAARPRFGLIATGKAYRDLRQALKQLGIDQARAEALGLAIFKVGMSWPLEPTAISEFAQSCERIFVLEHRRPVIEPQLKAMAYHWSAHARPPIWGKTDPDGKTVLPSTYELRDTEMLEALLAFLGDAADETMRARAKRLTGLLLQADLFASDARRMPYFCSGCPHSSSTKVPDGSRAAPGIGCHAMAEAAGRVTEGLTAMGGEGAPWVGAAPFARDKHMFINLGDGTYFHSGSLAIRQAVAAKVPVTYKILFNDAVAMTGGQPFDGPLSVGAITRQLAAEGVEKIVVLSETPEIHERATDFAPGVPVRGRRELMPVQRELAAYPGVSALIFDQTCAAEKRRRRRRGEMADPAKRLFINERVCEGCGDCSVQSNCVSVEPLETEFGTKRRINQSSCNKDFSCVEGFCPSFVWVDGGAPRKSNPHEVDIDAILARLPAPVLPHPEGAHNLLLTGIGGMGVTTAAAILAMAGHLDGLRASTLDMTGLAQKGGPVTSHVRFGPLDKPIEGPRIPTASADVVLAGDLIVAAGRDAVALLDSNRSQVIANTRVAPTAAFTVRQDTGPEAGKLVDVLERLARDVSALDIAGYAERLLGDTLYTNMLMVGMAMQDGLLPVSVEAMETAIRLNGAAVERNLRAFRAGRILAHDPDLLSVEPQKPVSVADVPLEERIDRLEAELSAYQNVAYGKRYRAMIERVVAADEARGDGTMRLSRLAAENLYKVMAYKDEYEVARLYSDPKFLADLDAQFEGRKGVRVMMAPPMISRTDPETGRPVKRAFGGWILPAMGVLAKFRTLRGTWADPFGHSAERKAERALIGFVFKDLERVVELLNRETYDALCELAALPGEVRGYGPVKDAAMRRTLEKRDKLLEGLSDGPGADAPSPYLEAAE